MEWPAHPPPVGGGGVSVSVEEKRRSIGFCAIHCFGSSKEKKSRFGTLIFVSIELWYGNLFRFMYGFVG